jgi:NADPH-dependent 2,4-dienoyl-CoA reductase/sulfur reductase-like enzyme
MSAVPSPGSTIDAEAVVCGAGAAGLASAAALKRKGVQSLVLERSGHVGNSWRQRYDTLRLNTLGWMSTLPGHHVGRRLRHFPTRDDWVAYLERYAAREGLTIEYETEALRIDRVDGGWRTETSRGALSSRFVVVAAGYDHDPVIPDWPGRDTFTGELIHSSEYRNAAPYRGRDVLVVGPNVTGSEIAYYLAEGDASRVRVATRTPPNILRRCRMGLPLNPNAILLERLPASVGDRLTGLTQRMLFGDLSPYGLSRPPLGVVSNNRQRHQGPAIDDGFVAAVKAGKVEIVAGVEALDGADVVLSDASRIQPDAVIAATGYARGLEPVVGHLGILDDDGQPSVLGTDTHPHAPGLHFVGYTTPIYGQLRGIRLDAKRAARAIANSRSSREAA